MLILNPKKLALHTALIALLVTGMNLVAYFGLLLIKDPSARDWPKAYVQSGLAEGFDADLLQDEMADVWGGVVYDPYLGFRALPNYRGQYVNTDAEGFRRTSQYLKGREETRHWMFMGGSTMWGVGPASDSETIPSHFAKLINEADPDKDHVVTNYGMGGYHNSQELILFLGKIGFEDVDYVVFFDFVSESNYPFSDGAGSYLAPDPTYSSMGILKMLDDAPGRAMFLAYWTGRAVGRLPLWQLGSRAQALLKQAGRAPDQPVDIESARKVARLYRRNKTIIDAVAAEYGVKTFFIMQPNLFTKSKLSEYERTSPYWKEATTVGFTRAVYSAGRNLLDHDGNFLDLSNVVDVPVTLYLDDHHTNGEGNLFLAEKILGALRNMVQIQ